MIGHHDAPGTLGGFFKRRAARNRVCRDREPRCYRPCQRIDPVSGAGGIDLADALCRGWRGSGFVLTRRRGSGRRAMNAAGGLLVSANTEASAQDLVRRGVAQPTRLCG